MALDITGKLISKLNKTDGTSKAGKPWSKQEFVLETQEQYPRKVCMSVMNEKVTELERYQIGDTIKASLNIESREYNGKWYTDVRAWRLEAVGDSVQSGSRTMQPTAGGSGETFYADPEPADGGTDDLPF